MATCKYCDAEIEWEDKVPRNADGSRHMCKKKENLPKPCKYECGRTLLWNYIQSVYVYKNTMLTHTNERCQEAKLKLEQKNDHGNEDYNPIKETQRFSNVLPSEKKDYVDHTQGQKLKLKILTSTEAEGLALAYNNFPHPIKFSQYQIAGSLYTIAIYYEETA